MCYIAAQRKNGLLFVVIVVFYDISLIPLFLGFPAFFEQKGYSEEAIEQMQRDVFMYYLMQNASDSH